MKLYGSYTSPYVRHCRIALLEAGLIFEFIETDQTASASKSPTKRVPFLEDGDIFLTDSSAIIRYIREKVGTKFLPSVAELNQYCLVNSALDSCTNLFFLQRDGVNIEAFEYTKRQKARIESSLVELNSFNLPMQAPITMYIYAWLVFLPGRCFAIAFTSMHIKIYRIFWISSTTINLSSKQFRQRNNYPYIIFGLRNC